MVFEDKLPGLDFAKVLKMCVVHDLGESINGDVPAVMQEAGQEKSQRERRDLVALTVSQGDRSSCHETVQSQSVIRPPLFPRDAERHAVFGVTSNVGERPVALVERRDPFAGGFPPRSGRIMCC
jgi:hypothetical protein